MNLGNYAEEAILNLFLRNTAVTALASQYVSLHDAAGATESSADWITTELDTGTALNYDRVQVDAADWSDPAGVSICESLTDLVWPTAGSAWGDITHVAIWDDPDPGQGNMIFWFELPNLRTVNNGDVFRLAEGNVTVEMQ